MIAIIVAIIASVVPQQTVTCSSATIWQAVAPRELARDRLAQRPRAPGDGVLVDVGVDRGAGRVLDRRRRRKVRKPLRQVDAAVELIEPRHLADDRLGELRGFLRSGELRHGQLLFNTKERRTQRISPAARDGHRVSRATELLDSTARACVAGPLNGRNGCVLTNRTAMRYRLVNLLDRCGRRRVAFAAFFFTGARLLRRRRRPSPPAVAAADGAARRRGIGVGRVGRHARVAAIEAAVVLGACRGSASRSSASPETGCRR